ncbi:unnamed protein product [marine sediment metagenome]|uniref:Uncharacterized protein n=1 Tax=marine sediment metagenome TaxID=412755 RepID=X1Q5C9_9ZZZZ
MKKDWDSEKVLCFHDSAPTVVTIENFHIVSWDLNLSALVKDRFYLLALNSKYQVWDNLPETKRNFLTKYSNDANVWSAIKIASSPPKDIGDFLDVSAPIGFDRLGTYLNSDEFYDFNDTPIMIQGSRCYFSAILCVSCYMPVGTVQWQFDFLVKVGLILIK